MKNQNLKDIVIEARGIYEVAKQAAKASLNEEYAPQVAGVITKQLKQEIETPVGDEEAVEEGIEDSSDIGTGDNKEPSSDSNDTSGIGTPSKHEILPFSEAIATEGEEVTEQDEIDDSLDEVIKSLEEDVTTKDDDDLDSPSDAPAPAPAPETPAPDNTPAVDSDAVDDLDLDAFLREMEAEESDVAQAPAASVPSHTTEQVAELEESLKEHKAVVKFLQKKLNEVGLVNAKLLYANKVFRSYGSLTTEQKVNVVKTLDRANSVRETKLVYATLVEAFSAKKKATSTVTEGIVKGLASKATGVIAETKDAPAEDQNILEEADRQVARLKNLAGIRRKK